MEGLDPAEGAMSETPRPSYLEYGGDKKNLLGKSWDAESRFRLQENALSLPTGEDDNALFRVKVELGLHELTAALTSLSRRIDKLEENTAPPDTKKQDEAVKELARSARCLSQALPGGNVDLSVAGGGVAMGVRLTVGINQFRMDPGIASARTRRRAIHGYFRESDEQRGGYGDRIDPAARALVIEGLACLAGKVGVETARGSKANGGRVWSSTTRATRGLSPSPPRRRKPSIHPSVGETSVASEEEQMLQGGVSRDGGDKDTRMLAPSSERDFSSLRNLALPRGFAPEGEYAPSRLEVEHLRGSLGPSLSPSPITLTGSTNGRMFPPAPAHKKSKDTRSPREESKVGRWAEGARLPEPNDGKPRNNTSASGGSNDGGGGGGGGSISSSLSSSSAVQDDSSSRAVNGASANSSALGATSGSRVEKGRALKGTRGESPDDASVVPVVASEKSVDNCDSGNKNTTQLMNAASTDTGGTRDTAGETGGASDRDVMVRMLLNAAGAAAEAEERAGGPGAHGDGQGLAKRSLRSSDGAASKAGKAGGSIQVGQDDPGNFRREVDAVRALSSHLHGSASSTSSSRSASAASCSRPATGSVNVVTAAAPAAVVRRAKATEVPKDKSGGNVSPAASSLDASENARPRSQRSLLDVADGKESPLVDGGRRSSFSCRNEVSLERDGGARLVDAQGFLDLGPASICRENSAGLAELEGRQSKGPGPEVSDPGVAELEAKLEELRKIGDRIKDEAAATMEPSVTIPSQDYSESGSPFPPSRHPHHPGQMSRSGRTRGSKPVGAAAGSAFTSAESSPYRSAVDLSSSAAPPPRPCDHQGTQPALSKLLVPPFNNAALRGEFVASLEQHFAQYEDGSRDTVEDDAPGKAGGDGNVKVNDMVAACDGDGDQDCRNGSRDRSDGTSNSVLGTVTTVREIPASCVAAEARSKRTVLTPPREVGEAANATPNATDATSGVSREETDGLMEGEGYDDKTPIEETAARMDAETSINWAQEYHDYLCSKDP